MVHLYSNIALLCRLNGKMLPKHGLGSISKHQPTGSTYIKLEQFAIPPGWSNNPFDLDLAYCFNGKVAEENLTEQFKTQINLPNSLPIIVHKQHRLSLIDGGNGKFYVWQDVEDYVGEFYECNLAILLFAVGKDLDLKGVQWRKLGHLHCGPADFDAPWK